ncbi:MAG: hypothetical protein COB16_08975 [Rhodobacteraceae bacterium]|nr:MAG: hypothetical protein COB16_08975 [Paracoccaceae bacterium]
MKRIWIILLALLLPVMAMAQSSEVLPSELTLTVAVEERDSVPYVREMVLITIRGVYRRHITLEKLVQPDFDGFSWTQLGPDHWSDERVDGRQVKILRRRMAIYPNRAGELTIGSFQHNLTLTDEGDDWFDHQIQSEPVTITVAPIPPEAEGQWWFPARWVRVSDQWSNAPDQLAPGEGVLRVVRIEALGVTPEMIPPMPVLTSPSAMIFPHPEKRLVDLTANGPVTHAFWRWTIRPTNTTSTIVEPLEFSYFDTTTREHHTVSISAQRVAYGNVVPQAQSGSGSVTATVAPSHLPGWPVAMVAGLIFVGGIGAGLSGWRLTGRDALHRFALFDPLARQLRGAARAGMVQRVRRLAHALARRDGLTPIRRKLLAELDHSLFALDATRADLRVFARAFLAAKQTGRHPI